MKTLQKTIGYDTFEEISYVFDTKPEIVEDVTKEYDLNKLSEIYTKMCGLGYKFNWREFIKNGK